MGTLTAEADIRSASAVYQLNGLSENGEEKGSSGLVSPRLLPGGFGGAEVIMTREME